MEEHSHRNILNLITEQAYSPATSKLLCALQSAVQFWSLLVSCYIITKQNMLQVSSFSQKVSYHRTATFVQQLVQVSHCYVALPCNECQGGIKWVKSAVVKETNLSWCKAQSLCNLLPLLSTYHTQKVFVNKHSDDKRLKGMLRIRKQKD